MIKRFIAVMLVICSLALLFSCKKTDPRDQIVVPEATKQPQRPSNDKEKVGGTLIMPIPENAERDNPYGVTTEEMLTMYSLIYEGLLAVDESGKLVPGLAMSWTPSSDYKQWTLSLRKSVTWHNGTEFTANDVVYSFEKLKSYLAGENPGTYYSPAASNIVSLVMADNYTVIATMKEEGLSGLYSLTFPIVCRTSFESAQINGTGPYSVSASNNKSVILMINKKWWKELPKIECIKFLERLNNETALASYEAGQMNFVPTSNLSAGKYRKEGETIVTDVLTQNAELLMFNYNNAALKNINVRRALCYAINQGKLITNVYMNKGQSCDVPIAPDSWLYLAKSKVIENNIAMANELLDKAGYKDSNNDGIRELNSSSSKLSFVMLVNEATDNTTRRQAADLIAEQALECGIEIKVVAENYSIGDTNSAYVRKLNSGDFDLALVGVNFSQDCDLTPIFDSAGALNYGNIAETELLNLATELKHAKDEAQMRECAYAFQEKFVQVLPFMVICYRLNSVVYSSELEGVTGMREPNILYNIPSWRLK